MRRLLLLTMLLVTAAVGCSAADKNEPVGAKEPSVWKVPRIIAQDNWWKKGEMGDVNP